MAVEPQMQRRWEEQLAAYVAASFRVTSLGNVASQSVQLVSKLVTAATLFFGARLVIEGSLTVGDILNTATEPSLNRPQTALPPIRGEISFDHVTFRYRPDAPAVLSDINLTIPAGQIVGIVGPSGSGKSTLARLVQRLYVPESGRVLVDGVDIVMTDTAWLRRQIGVVLQENVLFNRSVRDNIALT